MAAPHPPPSPPLTAAAKRRRKAPQSAARPPCFAGRHGDGVRRAGRHLARTPGRGRRTPLAPGPAAPPAPWEEPGVRDGGCGRAEPLSQRRAVPGGRVLAGPGGQGGPAEDERGLRAGTPAEESPAKPRQRLPGRAAGGARGQQLRHRRGEQRFVPAPGRRERPGAERGSLAAVPPPPHSAACSLWGAGTASVRAALNRPSWERCSAPPASPTRPRSLLGLGGRRKRRPGRRLRVSVSLSAAQGISAVLLPPCAALGGGGRVCLCMEPSRSCPSSSGCSCL